MVPGGRIELPTQGFSGPCSTTELPWQINGLQIPTLFIFHYSFFINFLVGMGGLNNAELRCEFTNLWLASDLPDSSGRSNQLSNFITVIYLVGMGGLEPPTSSLSETRSNQLSYMPVFSLFIITKKTKLVDYITISHVISSKKTTKFPCLKKRNNYHDKNTSYI